MIATSLADSSPSQDDDSTSQTFEDDPESRIIGTKEFNMDDRILDVHIESTLQWWYGLRPPKGVEVEHENRCQ